MKQPLILITNDDGITAPGLWALVEALLPVGELLVVAPDRQWSASGRSMPAGLTGQLTTVDRTVQGMHIEAYALDATPALAVVHGLLEFSSRPPDLVVSGINSGQNISIEVTASGTVGAALEAAAAGIPALAVSLALPLHLQNTDDGEPDYRVAAGFARTFAQRMLARHLPYDATVLNVNVPQGAGPDTPWRLTHLARQRYFIPTPPERHNGQLRPGYRLLEDLAIVDPNSDVHALLVDGVVSVTPLSMDLTSRADFGAIEEQLRMEL